MADPPVRLLNFVSENELEEGREKGVVPRDDLQSFPDRPLFEILKENKDKKDAEFNELLKHRPPKALDEDETEFLDSLEMYKKQQEQELAQEEARELTGFHAAIASRTITAEEPRQLIPTTASTHEAVPGRGKRLSQASVVTSLIRIKSHPKRAKVESSPKEGSNQVLPVQKAAGQQMLGLVSYPDESDEEEQIQ
ncbi:unnamed protein product [Sphagnum jensenii]|uniref:FAM192A/Fyv6 N-terminal domain-containing protein n=1 Tax=Sphagnum jensenii TaxID=128206 RepID=A0ABP1ABG1_9BRYO